MHGFTKCDCINKFFLTEGNKKILIHKEKSRFPFSATAHRDFEIFKKAVLDFCGMQSLAEAKGLGRSMDFSFMSTLPLNMYQTAVHWGVRLEFAPVKRVEQPEFSKEEGREGAPTSRENREGF